MGFDGSVIRVSAVIAYHEPPQQRERQYLDQQGQGDAAFEAEGAVMHGRSDRVNTLPIPKTVPARLGAGFRALPHAADCQV
jgi:hypothetical protein